MIRVRIPIIPIAIFIIFLLYSLNSWRHENTTGISPNLGYDKFLNHGKPIPPEALEIAKIVDQVKDVSSFSNSDVVFVTYASDNHFLESRNAIHNIRQYTNATIVYYDLGLKQENAQELRTLCNLRLISFNFSNYPTHVKKLYNYAFKPILIAEAYRDYPAFWVIDASAKLFNGTNMNKFYDKVQNGAVDSFTAEHPEGHTIARMTTPAMFNYLPLSLKERNSGMVQANTMFISRSIVSKEIVRWNLLCALVKECIAPEGASVDCSKEQPSCHRYDQSSLSIIMCASRLRRGLSCLSRTATNGAFSAFIGVERDTEYKGPLPTC